MPNITLSPTLLIGLLLAIICLLLLVAYFAASAKRRLDTIVRQQGEMIAVLASSRERARSAEPEQPRSSRNRTEPRLADDDDEAIERSGRARSSGDLVARR